MQNRMVRALCLTGGIRILACDAREMAREIALLQNPSATASIAIARGIAAGALMGALLKEGQRIALKFEGNGPLKKMIVEADSDGAVRCCVGDPSAEVEPRGDRWNVAGLIGKAGFLTVSKDLGMGGEPYRGVVQLVSSEIGQDLAYYLTESEQTPTAIGLAASLDMNGNVAVCGGFLVQALPKADPSEIEIVMERIEKLPSLSSLLEDVGPEGMVKELFGDIPYTLLETHEIFFRCGCNREKVEQALLSLGVAELRDIRSKENHAEVSCEFCRKIYRFEESELEQLITRLSQKSY